MIIPCSLLLFYSALIYLYILKCGKVYESIVNFLCKHPTCTVIANEGRVFQQLPVQQQHLLYTVHGFQEIDTYL